MNLYSWDSEYLREYGSGYIIIMAENIEEARKKALEAFDTYDRDYNSYNYEEWCDKDDIQSINDRKETFKKDIESEPKTEDTLLIRGTQ